MDKKLHERLKTIYPESRSLEVDREFEAVDTVEPPFTKSKLEHWAEDPKRRDLRGFDTPDAKEPPIRRIIRSGFGSQPDYIADQSDMGYAPDWYVDEKFEGGRLLKDEKHRIVSFDTLQQAVKDAWRRDPGLSSLSDYLTHNDFVALWNHPIIQSYVDENTRPTLIKYLMDTFGIEQVKASRVLNRLTPTLRQKLLYKVKVKSLPKAFRTTKITKPKPGPKKRRTYKHWSAEEINFIKENIHLNPERLAATYNAAFSIRRSFGSIISKRNILLRKSSRS